MIYLVGSWHRARMWGIDKDVDVGPANREVIVITSLERAMGHRPRPSDEIITLHGVTSSDDYVFEAFTYLDHARELARGRREQSVRQAP